MAVMTGGQWRRRTQASGALVGLYIWRHEAMEVPADEECWSRQKLIELQKHLLGADLSSDAELSLREEFIRAEAGALVCTYVLLGDQEEIERSIIQELSSSGLSRSAYNACKRAELLALLTQMIIMANRDSRRCRFDIM